MFLSKFSNLQYVKIRQNGMKNRNPMKENKYKNHEKMFEKLLKYFCY